MFLKKIDQIKLFLRKLYSSYWIEKIKQLEETRELYIHDLGFGDGFFGLTPKAWEIEEKIR